MGDSTQKQSGSLSISFVPKNYQAIYLSLGSATFSTSSYSGLEFYINGAPNGGQKIRVGFRKTDADYGTPTFVLTPAVTNQWKRVYVPFSAMNIGPGDSLKAITIQSDLDSVQARVYVDSIRLICDAALGPSTDDTVPSEPQEPALQESTAHRLWISICSFLAMSLLLYL